MSRTVADLVYLLIRQYPSGVTTMGNCPVCSEPAKGGGKCANCLGEELIQKGVSSGKVLYLKTLLENRKEVNRLIDGLVEEIFEDVEGSNET